MLGCGLDGAQAAEEICTSGAIPIIFMTGCSKQDVLKRLKHVTPAGFLLKPFEESDLLNAIHSVFSDVNTTVAR